MRVYSLTNGKLIEYTGGDLIQAIYDIDPTPLLAPALPPPPEPTPSNNTAPFPSSGIPGTHPEDSLPSRSTRSHDKGKGRAINQGGSEAGPSEVTTGRVEGEEEMPAAQQQQGREVSESVSPPKKVRAHGRSCST